MSNVVATSAEQGSAINAVSRSILAMDQVMQQNVALVEETAAATASLRQQAQTLTAAKGSRPEVVDHPEASGGDHRTPVERTTVH